MPKYYCEYCDIYLTHSSAGGRRQHNSGRKHINNKIEYYTQLIREKMLAPPIYPVPAHLQGAIRPHMHPAFRQVVPMGHLGAAPFPPMLAGAGGGRLPPPPGIFTGAGAAKGGGFPIGAPTRSGSTKSPGAIGAPLDVDGVPQSRDKGFKDDDSRDGDYKGRGGKGGYGGSDYKGKGGDRKGNGGYGGSDYDRKGKDFDRKGDRKGDRDKGKKDFKGKGRDDDFKGKGKDDGYRGKGRDRDDVDSRKGDNDRKGKGKW